MKKFFIALFAFFSVLAYSDNHERGTWVAAEYHFCNFNEGQDVDDLLRVVGKFNKFLDEHADKGQYDAVLLQEIYDVDNDWDYVWSGHWPSNEDMANGMQNWVENGGSIQKEFDKVSSCSAIRGYQYIYNSSAPEGKVWPVQYRSCSLKEGASHQEVRDLYDRAAEQWSDDGLKGGGRLFYQQLGSVEHNWDNYTQVVSPGSFANEAVNRALLDELDYSGINAEWAELVDCTPYVLYAGSYLTKPLD